MTAPFTPLTVIQRWVYAVLAANATIDAQVGADNIWPNVSPSDVTGRHLTHGFAGPEGGIRAQPLGRALSQIGLRWDVTGWEPSYSQQALEPVMEAVMTTLIGADARGKVHRFADGARSWTIECDYFGPVQVPIDLAPAGVWAPVSERYSLFLRRAA